MTCSRGRLLLASVLGAVVLFILGALVIGALS